MKDIVEHQIKLRAQREEMEDILDAKDRQNLTWLEIVRRGLDIEEEVDE